MSSPATALPPATSFASLPLAQEDDEDDDADFVLPDHRDQSGNDGYVSSSSSSSSLSSASSTTKRKRKSKGKDKASSRSRLKWDDKAEPSVNTNDDSNDHLERERRRRVEALWAEMKDAGSTSQRENSRLRPARFGVNGSSSGSSHLHHPAPPNSSATDPAATSQPPNPIPQPTADDTSSITPTTSQKRQPPQRRKSNLLALAAKYGLADAAKLSVLEQSKADWKRHVETEGDRHSLDRARKDGYLEKVDFLNRTDDRQAELQKKLKKARAHRRKG
ncbi:bucentaur or craniofacial development-domain-containing protein [Geranomyces variabilis]|nr:bucentaur or craniofacial development-domain-containing protein [Geranomyces variabilis]